MNGDNSMYLVYKKQLARKLKDFRESLELNYYEMADKIGVTYSSIYSWEGGKYVPLKVFIDKYESLGAIFTQREKNIVKDIKPGIPYSKNGIYGHKKNEGINKGTWEDRFNRLFTQIGNPTNAQGYDGDDWQIRDREPIKPSVIKEFIKKEFIKEGGE